MRRMKAQPKARRYGISILTRFGPFFLEATEHGLYQLEFPREGKSEKGVQARGKVRSRDLKRETGIRDLLIRAGRQLQQYLKGRPASFRSLRLDYSGLSPFECKVLRQLRKVPKGRAVSYAHLSRKAGAAEASRAVGSVMRKNRLPIIVPCHRIIRADGSLGRYAKGAAWKRRLLLLEGLSLGLSGARR